MQFPILIEKDEDGYYATCPTLEGCSTCGDTYEETISNIKEAIELYVEDCISDGELVIQKNFISLSFIDLPVKNNDKKIA